MAKRARRLHRRTLSWKAWKKEKRRNPEGEQVVLYRGEQRIRARATGRRGMPSVFCLDRNPDETIAFLAQMRETILTRGAQNAGKVQTRSSYPRLTGWFDFGTIGTLGVSAALVLAALFDRQKSMTGWRLSTINEHEWRPEVRAIFRMVGFHQLLEMSPQTGKTVDLGAVRVLRFVSGDDANGMLVGPVQEALTALVPEDEQESLLYAEPYGGILEAILNSSTWAYPEGTVWDFPQVERWWITGAVDYDDKSVSIAVYDQGITIPVSLPKWKHWTELESRLQRLGARLGFVGSPDDPRNDGAAIALAAKIARSKTDLPQHGKGLHTMLEVAQRAKHGRLRILSRYGEYVWERGRPTIIRNLPTALSGTLIEWTLDL